jgi:hypothetical protein
MDRAYLPDQGHRWESAALKQEIAAMPAKIQPSATAELPAAEGMLTPREYARAAKISLSWLAKARKRGDGPLFVRFGRSVRYFPLNTPD